MDMKNRIILFIGIIFLFSACSNKDKLKISGKISEGTDQVLYLNQLDLNGEVTIDSVKLSEKGNFKFLMPKLEYPTFFLLKFSDNNFITLLADSTERVEIVGEAQDFAKNYTVKNSLGSKYIQVLNTKLEKTKVVLDSLVDVYNSINKENSEELEEIRNRIQESVDKQKDFVNDFVMANPKSFASYYAVFQRYDDGTLVLNPYEKKDLNLYSTVATSLDVYYPECARSKQLKNFVLGIHKERKLEAMQKQLATEASKLPEIEEENLYGKKIKLSSLKGKMVLLSFWASWDDKSSNENKNLLKIYSKYKAKGFEIYQVSLDRSKILWEGAVEKDKLPWINVSDLKFTDSYPARIYNVQQLPANYLISKDGEIIGKDLFGRILDEKLNDLLN